MRSSKDVLAEMESNTDIAFTTYKSQMFLKNHHQTSRQKSRKNELGSTSLGRKRWLACLLRGLPSKLETGIYVCLWSAVKALASRKTDRKMEAELINYEYHQINNNISRFALGRRRCYYRDNNSSSSRKGANVVVAGPGIRYKLTTLG